MTSIDDGPYADEMYRDGGHGGYVGRVLPDGTVTGWTGGPDRDIVHIGLVGGCDCGWRSDMIRPAGAVDSEPFRRADNDVWTEHLQPLMAGAEQQFWPTWVTRTVATVHHIAEQGQQGRLRDAQYFLYQLTFDLARRGRLVAELLADQEHPDQEHPGRDQANPAPPAGADGCAGQAFPPIATPAAGPVVAQPRPDEPTAHRSR